MSELLYQKLVEQIKGGINQGLYKGGDKLPTEREFCEAHGVSRATVRRSLVELEKQKIIISRQGSGIYVSPYIFQQSLQRFYSFSQEMRRIGKTPSNRILSFEKICAGSGICETMELAANSPVIRIARLRLADGEPIFYETTYLLTEKMPDFTQEIFENHDLYDVMMQRYQISINRATESFRATLPNALIASYLKIKSTSPCVALRRITRDLGDAVVEYTQSIGRGDKLEFQVELNK